MKRVALGILSVMLVLAFAACGEPGGGEREPEWAAAFAEGNFAKYKASITIVWDDENEADANPTVLSVDSKKYQTTSGDHVSYLSEENGKTYMYSKGTGNKWTKTDVTGGTYISAYSFQFLADGEADFTLTDGWYVCKEDKAMDYARVLMGEENTPEDATGSFKLKLQDKKLVELVVEMSSKGDSMKQIMKFSDYGKVTVTLPEVEESPAA